MKNVIAILLLLSVSVHASSFSKFETKVSSITGYAKDSSYTSQHCILNFSNELPSSCIKKDRGIIYLEKSVGQTMCSLAMTALVTDLKVLVASHDDCDSTHQSPIIRMLEITR